MLTRTVDEMNTCPYTGLRSFTEEESLYFKGRDLQVDQITSLLEQNKFLMVTGASGEGKSSLIYAGLLPNARAGFFKARFSNWVVADFRPERNPVTNMAKSLAVQFGNSVQTIETELRRGYSSLIDLYTNSDFYPGDEGHAAAFSSEEIKDRKRRAANLIIIVDQFEEFFTNPENFYNESPSNDSQIVVNLILETARIAIRKNLPVYVVCTMRSDYIGQCSAFRGLPEYIGFSQFFVPRLKRKDLKQVIEEPALLSGIHISQRLIERLVFDISEGVDQLPILQHALSRIWNAADQGGEELDLIHYAMVGGMPAEDLPDEDMARFKSWFNTLPENQKHYYQETGLSKIIEIHANLLYENAWDYYNQKHPGHPISQQEAKRIIAISFSCLTKIDNSRAVRNRMSLEEITAIINSPELTMNVVGGILNIFRVEGNSFIRPFITEDLSTHELSPGTVLDITHESLIRNWNKLNQWANKEFEFYTTLLDLQKQLDRWKKSGRSRGYLLPVGPLSYFEKWYMDCRPNAAWIMRYAEVREDPKVAKQHAVQTLRDIQDFIRLSARKEFITRSFMKYGAGRIASIFAVIVMLVLSGFYWYNADQKKNGRVIERVKQESAALLNSREVNLTDKAIYLLAGERHDSASLIPYLEKLPYRSRISEANEVYKLLLSYHKHGRGPLKDSLLQIISREPDDANAVNYPDFILLERNKFMILLSMDQYYNADPAKAALLKQTAEKNYRLVLYFLNHKNLYQARIPAEMNLAIQYWLTVGKADPAQIDTLISVLSPLTDSSAGSAFHTYYASGSFEADGRIGINNNSGYHTLACLYAAAGDANHVFWSFQQILQSNQHDYFELPRVLNNHLNVLEYLYQYGHRNLVPLYLDWMMKNTADNKPETILRNAILRSGYISHMYFINTNRNYYRSTRGYLHPNLCLSSRSLFDAMTEDYEKAVREENTDPKERDYKLAMNLKRKAMFYSKYWYDRNMPADEQRLDSWLKQFYDYYGKMDDAFLDGTESSTMIYNGDGVRTADIRRRNLLLYPDYRDGWFGWTFHTDYLFRYLQKNHLFSSLYKTESDLQLLHYWIFKAYELKLEVSPGNYSNLFPLPDEDLKTILALVDQHPLGGSFDRNIIYGILSSHAFDRGDTTAGYQYYQKINLNSIGATATRYEYIEKTFVLNTMKDIAIDLALMGRHAEAMQIASLFPGEESRGFVYVQMAHRVFSQHADPYVFTVLDSVYATQSRTDNNNLVLYPDARWVEIQVLSEIGSRKLNEGANEVLRDIIEEFKFDGVLARVTGIAGEGNYYRALTSLPSTLTETQELQCRYAILLEDCRAAEKIKGDNRWKSMDENLNWTKFYVNYTGN